MTARHDITCPACGADFEVGERLEEIAGADQPPRLDEPGSMPPAGEPVSFACPACGADFETQERLVETER
jgi:C4-type Zn-finger protein